MPSHTLNERLRRRLLDIHTTKPEPTPMERFRAVEQRLQPKINISRPFETPSTQRASRQLFTSTLLGTQPEGGRTRKESLLSLALGLRQIREVEQGLQPPVVARPEIEPRARPTAREAEIRAGRGELTPTENLQRLQARIKAERERRQTPGPIPTIEFKPLGAPGAPRVERKPSIVSGVFLELQDGQFTQYVDENGRTISSEEFNRLEESGFPERKTSILARLAENIQPGNIIRGVEQAIFGEEAGLQIGPLRLGAEFREKPEKFESAPMQAKVLDTLERFRKRVEDPISAAFIQSAARGNPFALITGDRPRDVEKIATASTVDPFKAFAGDEEQQQLAQEILDEAGIGTRMGVNVITWPGNLLFFGPTRASNIIKLAQGVRRGEITVSQAVRAPVVQGLVKQARDLKPRVGRFLAEEAGGGARLTPDELAQLNSLSRSMEEAGFLSLTTQGGRRWLELAARNSGKSPEEIAKPFIAAGGNEAQAAADALALLKTGRQQILVATRRRVIKDIAQGNETLPQFAKDRVAIEAELRAGRAQNPAEEIAAKTLAEGRPEVTAEEALKGAVERGAIRPPAPAKFELHIRPATPEPPPPRPPAPPGGRPPPGGGLVGPEADDLLKQIQAIALKGEKPGITLLRAHGGKLRSFFRETRLIVEDGNELLKQAKMGTPFRDTRVPRPGEIEKFDELRRLLHNSSAVEAGRVTVPREMRPVYKRLRELTNWEEHARIDFDPKMATKGDYFDRTWKVPEGMFVRSRVTGQLGLQPGFKLPRVNATYEEMRALGFEPLFWNPFEQWAHSRMMGVRYREQMSLIEEIKGVIALPDRGGPIPQGWRVPRVGPAFEGKPFAIIDEAGNPRTLFTRRWVVPDDFALRLENVYGRRPEFPKIVVGSKIIDTRKVADIVTFLPKRTKLAGSVFQHEDFLLRSFIGAWQGMIDALRHGEPINAVKSLAIWPKTAVDTLRATVSPGFRAELRRMSLDTTPFFPERPGLHMRAVSDAGLNLIEQTTFPANLDEIMREVVQEAIAAKVIKAVPRAVLALERLWRQGLFQGMYPAASLTDIRNNIAPIVARNYRNLNDAQMAGQIAKIANRKYSLVPAELSVVQGQVVRDVLSRVIFSFGEAEGLLGQAVGAIKGPEAAFWREHWLAAFVGLIGTANVINFITTGKPLPIASYSPISRDRWGPLPIGYNRDFAAPGLVTKGRGAAQLTLDLVGQLDTAFRILDPAGFLNARESVPIRTATNQITGTDFFGSPIDDVGPEGIFSRTAQLIFDMFAPIGVGQAGVEIAREKIAEAESVLPRGESRLGMRGNLIQLTGINVRAEPTQQLLDRFARESEFKTADGQPVREWDDLEQNQKRLILEANPELQRELDLRTAEGAERGSQFAQYALQVKEIDEQTALDEHLEEKASSLLELKSPAAARVFVGSMGDVLSARVNQKKGAAAQAGIEFEDPEAQLDILEDRWFSADYDNDGTNDFQTDYNGNGIIGDEEDHRKAFENRDALREEIADISEAEALELDNPKRRFATVAQQDAAQLYLDAQAQLQEVLELSKYRGLTVEQSEQVNDIEAGVGDLIQQLKREGVDIGKIPRVVLYIQVARSVGLSDGLGLFAEAVRSGSETRDKLLNPDRMRVAIENQELLSIFFPRVLASAIPIELRRASLSDESFKRLLERVPEVRGEDPLQAILRSEARAIPTPEKAAIRAGR